MAYATYTTKAIVCGTFDHNTSDRSYLLFTREAGMLYANARSVRVERSKQRYALQDFSLVRASLVKGKRGWKIGSIETERNFYSQAVDKEARGSIVSLFRLLRRFVKGEEPAVNLFDYIYEALEELSDSTDTRPFVLMAVQVQVLAMLGYVDKKTVPENIRALSPHDIAQQHSATIEKQLENLYSHAISVSHL